MTEPSRATRKSGDWSTKKKDTAPRGVFRHRSGAWSIRYRCAYHLNQEQVGRLKQVAIDTLATRRLRARNEPGWCPVVEREQLEGRVRARLTFAVFAREHYLPHAQIAKRSWQTDASRMGWLVARLGTAPLETITAQQIDAVLIELRGTRGPATTNRYRSLISAIFKGAARDGHVSANPVKGCAKLVEPAGRIAFLLAEEEQAVREALTPAFRPHFAVSLHTGFRYAEQMELRWRDVDILTGHLVVQKTKNNRGRSVPMNSVVRSVLMDLAAKRARPGDPMEYVFTPRPVQSKSFFDRAIARAQAMLRESGRDAARLEGYVWHSESPHVRLQVVLAGVDLRTVQELGGWGSLGIVMKYAHLPGHRLAAVEALVPGSQAPWELRRNFDGAPATDPQMPAK